MNFLLTNWKAILGSIGTIGTATGLLCTDLQAGNWGHAYADMSAIGAAAVLLWHIWQQRGQIVALRSQVTRLLSKGEFEA